MISFVEWLAARGITNWVVARRTARTVRKYGDDVQTLSQKRYSALRHEYEASSSVGAA